MNEDTRLDTHIVAAANRRSDDTNTFTHHVMQKIRVLHAANTLQEPKESRWNPFAKAAHGHKLAFGVVAAVVISVVSFSGYAYAIGSDPVSLIKRWIEGDKVKIEYQGRQFEHGKSRNYSDAAVTALAEANTVEGLAFQAKNQLQVPKDGVEYVGLPPSMNTPGSYEYPYFATITAANAGSVTIHKQYLWGDKMNPSHTLDESQVIPTASFHYFVKGEPSDTPAIGTLLMVHPEKAVKHVIGTPTVTVESIYFGFALSHPLSDFEQVGVTGTTKQDQNTPLFESNWGGLSDICGNNGADRCDIHHYSQPENQGLFVATKGFTQGMNNYNQDAIRYGEAVGMGEKQPDDIISRDLSGTITAIDDSSITLTTSSGAKWRLLYTKAQQDAFAQHNKDRLVLGNKLVGMVLESTHNLDNRTIQNDHIMSLERYALK